ncbi:tyrosine-protein phosphatase non-receptor type 1 [Bombina bombina]|uniref:tyrosine-protein phosphatase non-receptor type 1 n=1 Tax=Bombina bombina TaxID=8345 RepID=UPI00235A481A|nr:tyrosine-protein phosphatase non-receptor type 1 [Bombina bombina]
MDIEKEFNEADKHNRWGSIYQDIRHEASDFPCKVARLPENKSRNRYRDVSPFDHSRIKLHRHDNDYINASLIRMEEAQRSYILTQGPLPETCGHFWEMVWEQRSRGVVMLNRVIEKGSNAFNDDVDFVLYLIASTIVQSDPNLIVQAKSENDIKFLTSFQGQKMLQPPGATTSFASFRVIPSFTQESREILHFHYTTWPDFGVPESPASFLNFLFKVRESGSLNPEHGPIVVHCSAGIGRSGTFCLADTCLLLMDKRKDPSSVDIKHVLLEMRKYRMGLIQTADQLRFSYLAVIEGAKFIMGDSSVQEQWKELSNEDLDPPPEHTPPPPRPPKRTTETHNGKMPEQTEFNNKLVVEEVIKQAVQLVEESVPDGNVNFSFPPLIESTHQDTETRRRAVGEEAHSSTSQDEKVKYENTEDKNRNPEWQPFIVHICMFTILSAGAYLCYRVWFH